MRSLLALAAVVVLAGCGSATVEHAGSAIVPDRPSPPITAVDEAPPDDVLWFLKQDFQVPAQSSSATSVDTAGKSLDEICFVSSTDPSAGSTTSCPPPTPEQRAKAEQEQERFLHSIRPASDSQPRVIAKLALAGGGDELFTAWHNAEGKLCWETDDETPRGGGGSGPSGPCVVKPEDSSDGVRCDTLCLQSDGGSSDGAHITYELSGTVPTTAAAIRVTAADGQVSTYELDGPVVDGDRRVLMLQLGPSDWRTVELVRHGAVFDTDTMPKATVAIEECNAQVGSMPQPSGNSMPSQTELEAYSRKVDACLKTKPGWSAWPGPSTGGLDTATSP